METPNKTNFHRLEILSPSMRNSMDQVPWRSTVENSPSLAEDSPKLLNCSLDSATGFSKSSRGRPKSEILTTLMIQGSTSPSTIKCKFCNRVFPRDKSLSAHLRTHTGDYLCIS